MVVLLKKADREMIFLSSTIFFVIWQIASMIYPFVIVPSPYRVISNMIGYLFEPNFYSDLAVTLMRGCVGYILSIAIGVMLAFIIKYNNLLKKIIYPYLMSLQVIPRISWILLAMIWFPLNSQIVIFIIVMTIVPIIALNTLDGLEAIDYSLIEMVKIFNISKKEVIKGVIIPSIAPNIFSGMKIALGVTWKTVVMAELLTVQTGIGAQMAYAKTSFSTDRILALTIYIVLIGLFFQFLLSLLRKYFERWKVNE
jgi:NitT/TauT family transport system permease protein